MTIRATTPRDETTVRVKGRWRDLSRAINATGTTIDCGPGLATASQDLTLHVDGTAFLGVVA